MNYFLKIQSVNKAKNDIDDIAAGMGFRNLTSSFPAGEGMLARFLTKICGAFRILLRLK